LVTGGRIVNVTNFVNDRSTLARASG